MTEQEKRFRKIFLLYKDKELTSPPEYSHRDGKVGFLLESLFGLEPNTFAEPDWLDIEFKTFQKNSSSPMSLFTAVTSRGMEFTKELYLKHSYINEVDKKRRLNCRVTTKPNKHGFYLDIDKNYNRIYIRHIDGTNDYFETNTIIEKVNHKLKHTIAVEYVKNKNKYIFTDYTYYKISAEDFILGVENNIIDLYLKISTNNKGVCISRGNTFSISPSKLKFFNNNDKQQIIRKHKMKNKSPVITNNFAYGLAENFLMNDKDEALYKLIDKMNVRTYNITTSNSSTPKTNKNTTPSDIRRNEFLNKAGNGVVSTTMDIVKDEDGNLDLNKTILSIKDIGDETTMKSIYDFCKYKDSANMINDCKLYEDKSKSSDYSKYGFRAIDWMNSGRDVWANKVKQIQKNVD